MKKKKFKNIIIIIIVTAAICCYLFTKNEEGIRRIEFIPKDGFQNNLLNNNVPEINSNIFGYIVRQGDWYYYLNVYDDEKLYRIRTDGKMRKRLNNSQSSIVGISDDWICYINYSDNRTLYKIKTDGTGETKLVDERIIKATVSGEWVYYIGYQEDFSCLIRIRIDGTDKVVISSDCNGLVSNGDWVYFSNKGIYKIRNDGSEIYKLNDDFESRPLIIDGEWIYFTTFIRGTNWLLHRIKTDGSHLSEVIEMGSPHYAVKDGWVYYDEPNTEDGVEVPGLWRQRIEGSEKILVYKGGVDNIIVDGDWVYAYTSPPEIGFLADIVRIKKDGSAPEEYIRIN